MSFHLQRPSGRMVDAFLADARRQPLTYEPVGLSRMSASRYWVDEASVGLGVGGDTFSRARQAFQGWRQFELGWVEIFPRAAPVAEGTVIAVQARTLGIWSINTCRIVSTTDTPQEFSFAYGTLPNHAESGEEVFRLTFDEVTTEVRYHIRAVSRAHALLAKLGGPLARSFQARFRRDSLAAMQRAIARPK